MGPSGYTFSGISSGTTGNDFGAYTLYPVLTDGTTEAVVTVLNLALSPCFYPPDPIIINTIPDIAYTVGSGA